MTILSAHIPDKQIGLQKKITSHNEEIPKQICRSWIRRSEGGIQKLLASNKRLQSKEIETDSHGRK
jgi:hypothetical protein